MPQRPSPDMRAEHRGDPLAAILRADDVVRPRAGFREDLRAELVSRPPVATVPPTRLPSRMVFLAVAAVLLIALFGVLQVEPWSTGTPSGPSQEVSDGEPHSAAGGVAPSEPTAPADPDASTIVDEIVTAPVTADATADVTIVPADPGRVPAVSPATASPVPTGVPTWPPTTSPAVVPVKATEQADKPPTVAVTPTDDDLPPGTPKPRPTNSTVTPTPTDAAYPELPAPPTAAPTSVGLPTAVAPATPGTSSGASGSSWPDPIGPIDAGPIDAGPSGARSCRLGLAP